MLRLQPMTEAEFTRFLDQSIRDYAADKVQAGTWHPEEALKESESSFQRYVPQGLATPDHFFYQVANESESVGHVWFMIQRSALQPEAFLLDFVVYEQHRRKGYGAQALRLYHAQVKAMGIERAALHVFGHNPGALALYEQAGYVITDINMLKRLDADETL